MNERIIVLLPAYKPAEGFVLLCKELREAGLEVWTVDDGSGEAYAFLFNEVASLGCTVVRHAVNLGKGRALKTGINAILDQEEPPFGLVTADADGQHKGSDILRIADALRERPNTLITGCRRLSKDAPFKSRAGNAVARHAFRFATGINCHDTQTGLRGIPGSALSHCLSIPGERYEYEMNMLLRLKEMRLSLHEIGIETIYIDNNKGSHFRPFRDAVHVLSVILRFALMSLLSFFVDYFLYVFFLNALVWAPALSYTCARMISSLFNYAANRVAVFGGIGGRGSVFRYYLVATTFMLVGSGLVELSASVFGYKAAWIKIPIDVLLFFASFWVQREFVFKEKT